MRTGRDRLRHVLLFEAILLTLTALVGPLLLHVSVGRIGTLGALMSLIAMLWNFVFNVGFDRALLRLGRPLQPRSFRLRAAHSVLFELGFMGASVPLVMVWLDYSLWEALVLDLGFLLFIPVFALVFNWAYDTVFPCPTDGAPGAA